jgi:membrane associated rhomboid family serine protease
MEPTDAGEIPASSSSGAVPEPTPPRRLVPITLAVCVVCASLFLLIGARGGKLSWESLAPFGYLPAERIWDGAYWALISSAFIHLELWHVAFNVYWLWTFGSAVEPVLGMLPFAGLVLVSALVSSSIQLGASGDTGIGASGVVYALFGLMWAGSKRVPRFAQVLGENTAPLFWVWLVGCILATRAGIVQVGNAAHVGGLLLGLLAAHWLIPGAPRRALAIVGSGLFVLLSLVPLVWSPWSPSWVGQKAYEAHVAGELDAAIAGYRRSIALGGDRAWALANLASAYLAKGQENECAAAVSELRAIDPAAAATLEADLSRQRGAVAEKAP